MQTEQKRNFQVVFNRSHSFVHINFYLSVKIFHQYIFYLPSFSLWAATFLLPWFGKWLSVYSQTAKTVFSHLI